jgi:CubicO group peptidase (beta-lactamase class C family)
MLGVALTSLHVPSSAAPLPAAPLADDAKQFEAMHALIQGYIDRGEIAGAVTLVARDGRIVDVRTYGWSDLVGQQPMRRDSLFRLASMTKIVTAVAVLSLYEDGRLKLDDPIEKYLPGFRAMRVCVGGSTTHLQCMPTRPITIRHLLTHTSGLAADGAVQAILRPLYDQAVELTPRDSLQAYVTELAKLPLCNQPGDAMHYGLSYEVLGRLVEVVAGKPFDAYVRDRICAPLGMEDTVFQIPKDRQPRLALTYIRTPGKPLELRRLPEDAYCLGGPGIPRGSGGLISTADDFARFLQMLLNQGDLAGVRILQASTVGLMTTDQLKNMKEENAFLAPFESYGLGVSVRVSQEIAPTPGSVGQFGWSGSFTTWCSVDPKQHTVALLLTQHLPWNDDDVFGKFATALGAKR